MHDLIPIQRFLTKDIDEPGAKLLGQVLASAATYQATDIYLRKCLPIVFRSGGENEVAEDWIESLDGNLSAANWYAIFDFITSDAVMGASVEPQSQLEKEGKSSFTRVFRTEKGQIRMQYSAAAYPPTIVVRRLPLSPPPIEKYFGSAKDVISLLERASGLYIVCGPIGAGKTTLAASIASFWAAKGKHVAVVADPVEYFISNERVMVTQFECALTTASRRNGLPFIDQVVPDILRSNVDAMFISEVRAAEALPPCLELSRTREPVITTFHASSIADAVIGILGMAEQVMGQDSARLLLANCLEGVFYVDLAYSDKKEPLPIVQFLPISKIQAVRKAIGESKAGEIAAKIDSELRNPSQANVNITIGYVRARAIAKQLGVSDDVIARLVPSPSVT